MTPKLRQIFRYEVCIIPKDMKIYLNRFRTILVTDLHQKYVGSHKHNSLFSTTSASYYKYNMLTYGEFYMLISKMLISASRVFLLNQIIWFISSVLWVFVINFQSTIFLMKNYMMDQILQ